MFGLNIVKHKCKSTPKREKKKTYFPKKSHRGNMAFYIWYCKISKMTVNNHACGFTFYRVSVTTEYTFILCQEVCKLWYRWKSNMFGGGGRVEWEQLCWIIWTSCLTDYVGC